MKNDPLENLRNKPPKQTETNLFSATISRITSSPNPSRPSSPPPNQTTHTHCQSPTLTQKQIRATTTFKLPPNPYRHHHHRQTAIKGLQTATTLNDSIAPDPSTAGKAARGLDWRKRKNRENREGRCVGRKEKMCRLEGEDASAKRRSIVDFLDWKGIGNRRGGD
ncbi:hypothetical protein QYF36_006660 [Acer negundo]|nr:hypothetical protein QYF36_006660 [Acer negundo]